MKIAIYPGSFDPIHDGHIDVIKKALKLCDTLIIAQGINPDKKITHNFDEMVDTLYAEVKGRVMIKEGENLYFNMVDSYILKLSNGKQVIVTSFRGLLKDFAQEKKADFIIKGLRDTNDFLYEQKQQYHNEDLGIKIPTVYIISDRSLVHVSSSAIKAIDKFRKEKS